jgi:CheY-like chemotaxis protein
VLLVEDNLINQTVARKMLSGLGLVCEVGRQGLYLANTPGIKME